MTSVLTLVNPHPSLQEAPGASECHKRPILRESESEAIESFVADALATSRVTQARIAVVVHIELIAPTPSIFVFRLRCFWDRNGVLYMEYDQHLSPTDAGEVREVHRGRPGSRPQRRGEHSFPNDMRHEKKQTTCQQKPTRLSLVGISTNT